MGKVTLVVKYDVVAERRAELVELLQAHAAGTMTDEEGCVGFDILVPKEDPARMFLAESYRDDAAYALHTESPRLAPLRESYKDMVVNRRIVLCDVV